MFAKEFLNAYDAFVRATLGCNYIALETAVGSLIFLLNSAKDVGVILRLVDIPGR